MHINIFIIISFLSVCALAQKSNLYQIFLDDINQQTFLDKKVNHIERKYFDYDTLTKKIKQTSYIKIDYDAVKKLCKTYNSWYKSTDYWKSDSNGVNEFTYDKSGILKDLEGQDTTQPIFENGRIKFIYQMQLFYNGQNKISKVITDTINKNGSTPFYFTESYYLYKHDSVSEVKIYRFRNNPNRAYYMQDTLEKIEAKHNALGFEATIIKKKETVKISNYTNNSIDFKDTYINGQLTSRVETYYGVPLPKK